METTGSLTSATDCSTFTSDLPSDVPTLQAMLTAEKMRNESMSKQLTHSVPMILTYQQYIPAPPAPKEALWSQACSNDKITSESWRETWLSHIAQNMATYDADKHQVSEHYGKHSFGPAIIAGSGPSLKKNVDVLARECPSDIPIVSCLHNFGFFVDRGVSCDYYVNLDAGEITIPEMTEGGSERDKTKYLKASEKRTLIAGLVSNPGLLAQWKGEILFFNATIPDPQYMERMPKLTKNRYIYSVGGNTLGACYYHAAFIFGCSPIAAVGADFSFDYMHKFHSWDSQYDAKFSGLVPCTDCFGNRTFSWVSYTNFAAWFMFQAQGGQSNHNIPLINCTEGGILGSFAEGNAMQIKQQRLTDWLDGYTRWRKLGEVLSTTPQEHFTVMC